MNKLNEDRRRKRTQDAQDALDMIDIGVGRKTTFDEAFTSKFVNVMVPFTKETADAFYNDSVVGSIIADIVRAMNDIITFDEVRSKYESMDRQGAFNSDIEDRLSVVIQRMERAYNTLEYSSCYTYSRIVGDDNEVHDNVLKTNNTDAIGFCLEVCAPRRA